MIAELVAEPVFPVSVSGWITLGLSLLALGGVVWQRGRKEALAEKLAEDHEKRLALIAVEHEKQLAALRTEREQRMAQVLDQFISKLEAFQLTLTNDLNGVRSGLTADINGLRQGLVADVNGLRSTFESELNGYGRRLQASEERVEGNQVLLNGALQTLAAMKAELSYMREFMKDSSDRCDDKLDRLLQRGQQ